MVGWTAASAQDPSPDLSSMSLEQLSQVVVTVTSVAKKVQDLWLTPAAVYVITKEDIAQSSASSIPELLRVVPGLQVAQINASSWAVTARGFNSEYASKLLVLVDGRTMYSEIYSGAHWDQVDLPLEQIERIEVIRGPGAAVWGTNAVNGVVNIISKKISGNGGASLTGHISRIDEAATVSYSGPLGSNTNYGGYVRYIDRKPLELPSGAETFDGAGTWRGGGRLDWHKSSRDSIAVNGDIYGGHLKTHLGTGPGTGVDGDEYDSMGGGYALGRWEHRTEKAQTAVQVYYDVQSRNELSAPTRTRTTDAEYQTHLRAGDRHDLVWGGEFRFTADHMGGTEQLTPQKDYANYLLDGFLQDDIALIPHRLTLNVGSKLQTGTLAGFQAQPSGRLLFAPDHADSIWVGISRAAVAPSIQDKYLQFPLTLGTVEGLPLSGTLFGNPDFKSETVLAYELGYRRRIGKSLTIDTASFFNSNRRIATDQVEGVVFVPVPSPYLLATIQYRNGYKAKSGGVEVAAAWTPWSKLALHGNYAWMEARTKQVDPGVVALLNGWETPRNAYTGTASWQISKTWSADGLISRVGNIQTNPPPSLNPAVPTVVGSIAAYTRVDAHVSEKIGKTLEVSVGGTNLQSPRHLEFDAGTGYVTPAYVPRSFFLKGKWTF